MEIKLSQAAQKPILAAIQRFVVEEYGESIGDLKAGAFLSFCLKEIGPAIYNQAIADAQACVQERVSDLENICFAEERSYWKHEHVQRVVRRSGSR